MNFSSFVAQKGGVRNLAVSFGRNANPVRQLGEAGLAAPVEADSALSRG